MSSAATRDFAGRIDLVNGPNLGALGTREVSVYGTETLADIEARVVRRASAYDWNVVATQSNHEGALVDAVHAAARAGSLGFVVNAAAYTHTSIALADAFAAVGLPYVEVHLSNVYARESFRHRSLLAAGASGLVIGCGPLGYELAVERLAQCVGAEPCR